MQTDASPETVLRQLNTLELSPVYLFYGPNEFLKEKVLARFRQKVLAPGTADFNVQVFYGDEAGAEEIIEAARSVPFMAERRLVIVRRASSLGKTEQARFLSYLDNPVISTCLIFVATDVNFRHPLFSRIRKNATAVHFTRVRENRIVPWLMATAKDMGLNITHEACAYLHQIVGNSLMELHGELEKLSLRYGKDPVDVSQVKEMATWTRAYSIFELTDYLSQKDCKRALEALHKLLEQGGRDSALSILGMLNRQFRLLWRVKFMKARGAEKEVPSAVGMPPFLARKLLAHVDKWSEGQLKKFLGSLCVVDSRLKSGSQEDIVLDHLIISLCND